MSARTEKLSQSFSAKVGFVVIAGAVLAALSVALPALEFVLLLRRAAGPDSIARTSAELSYALPIQYYLLNLAFIVLAVRVYLRRYTSLKWARDVFIAFVAVRAVSVMLPIALFRIWSYWSPRSVHFYVSGVSQPGGAVKSVLLYLVFGATSVAAAWMWLRRRSEATDVSSVEA